MKQMAFYNYFLALFFVIIISIPTYWLIRGPVDAQYSFIEARGLTQFPKISQPNIKMLIKRLVYLRPMSAVNMVFDGFSTLEFQNQLQKSTSDQFPLRNNIIPFEKSLERLVVNSVYSFLPDFVIPTDMHSGFYVTRDDNPHILFRPDTFDVSTRLVIDQRIENYSVITAAHPEINFYIFNLQRLSNSAYHPLNQYFPDADKGQALAYFESHKPDELNLTVMRIDSYQDHVNYFYATDHHMNLNGLGYAYQALYQSLSENFPEISPINDLGNVITFQEPRQLGALSRITQYPMEGDLFQVYKLDTPQYIVYSKSTIYPLQELQADMINNFSTLPSQEFYGKYYDLSNSIYDFEYEVSTDRNLLIIGSSFVRGVIPMIASHYHHTYYIDLRQNPISLSAFISEHPVDDIVIFGDNTVTFTDIYEWNIIP